MTSEPEIHNGYTPVLSSIDSAVDTATERLNETKDQAKVSALKLFDKVKAAVDNAYNEANERIHSHFHERNIVDSLEDSISMGETPHLVVDLVEEALGFDALYGEDEALIVTKNDDSILLSFPRGDLAVRLETYDLGSTEQTPALRCCMSRRFGFLVQPLGVSKKEIYPGTMIYCTVYSDSFSYSPLSETKEDGTVASLMQQNDSRALSSSRLEAPEAMSTLYIMHNNDLKKNFEDDTFPFALSDVESIVDAVERKFASLRERDVEEEHLVALDAAYSQFQALLSELSEEQDVILLGDSLPSVVFREFIGSVANVNTFYRGPAVFDLGYVAQETGLLDNEHELYAVLYRYRLGSRSMDPTESEGLIKMAIRVGTVLQSLKDIDTSLRISSV